MTLNNISFSKIFDFCYYRFLKRGDFLFAYYLGFCYKPCRDNKCDGEDMCYSTRIHNPKHLANVAILKQFASKIVFFRGVANV